LAKRFALRSTCKSEEVGCKDKALAEAAALLLASKKIQAYW
jgi:hypothetical protein